MTRWCKQGTMSAVWSSGISGLAATGLLYLTHPFPSHIPRLGSSRHLPGQSLEQATGRDTYQSANIDLTRWQLKITCQRPQVRQGRPLSCVVCPRLPPQGLLSHILLLLYWKKKFWPHPTARGTLVSHPRMEPVPPALEGRGLNHWTTRKVPDFF